MADTNNQASNQNINIIEPRHHSTLSVNQSEGYYEGGSAASISVSQPNQAPSMKKEVKFASPDIASGAQKNG
jgi:hypothetical protein